MINTSRSCEKQSEICSGPLAIPRDSFTAQRSFCFCITHSTLSRKLPRGCTPFWDRISREKHKKKKRNSTIKTHAVFGITFNSSITCISISCENISSNKREWHPLRDVHLVVYSQFFDKFWGADGCLLVN